MTDDGLDEMIQPRCPECGTVLRDSPPGYVCAPDELLFLRTQV